MPRLSNKSVIDAIRASGGLISIAARKLGCSRQAIYKRVKAYPPVAEALAEERELFLDVCEGKLRAAVNDGEGWAIQFALRSIGRERGYLERGEVALVHRLDKLSDSELTELEHLPDHELAERLGLERREHTNGRRY